MGFVPESLTGIAALRLGEMRDGKLMYAGKIGTGWGRAVAADIRRRMDAQIARRDVRQRELERYDLRILERSG